MPDLPDDEAVGKFNLVSVVGRSHGFALYAAVVAAALVSIVAAVAAGYLAWPALLSLGALAPALAAVRILKRHYDDKAMMIRSSRLGIVTQTVVSLVLIVDVLL